MIQIIMIYALESEWEAFQNSLREWIDVILLDIVYKNIAILKENFQSCMWSLNPYAIWAPEK